MTPDNNAGLEGAIPQVGLWDELLIAALVASMVIVVGTIKLARRVTRVFR